MKVYISNEFVKWKEEDIANLSPKDYLRDILITIDEDQTFQKHLGFGGAFTDATVINYLKLNNVQQQEVIESLFGSTGLKYNLGRYPIHSTDFSPESYFYIEKNDTTLSTFSIQKDEKRLGFTRKCLQKANDLIMFAAPWTPVPFMKTNNNPYRGGHLKKEFYQSWADYLVKALKAYKDNGVRVDVISTQNEPLATQVWESCRYTPKQEGVFVSEYLIPTLRKNGLDTKIAIWDHNRDVIYKRIEETLKFIDTTDVFAIAYHWYDHSDFKELSRVHELCPNAHLLLTECCVELGVYKDGIGQLKHAEIYAHEIINDFNNYSEGYIDWNMILDERGGPNHVGNYCEAPIMVEGDNIRYLPSYFYIGHFSRFISRGDVRIFSAISNDNVEVVSYKTMSSVVSVLLNRSNDDYNLVIDFKDRLIKLVIKKHSIMTIVF